MISITFLDIRLMLARQPGIAFLLCLLVVVAGWLLAHPPQAQPAEMPAGLDPARLIAAQRSFRSLLIPPAKLAAAQQALLDAAASQHLSIGQVDYSKEVDAAGGFSQVSMRLPVTGRYGDIRTFLEGAITDQPAFSLRHLGMQRETTSHVDSTVTATLTAQFLVGEPMR